MNKSIFLCAISNISSGSCAEDCGFCTQSARHHVDIERYKYKPVDQIVFEANNAANNGAIGFCLVTSGLGLDDKKLAFVCEAARAVKAELPDLNLIACNGIATVEQLKTLKDAGINSYNHNLESSKTFYTKICTTHSWESRYQTCMNVKEVGLSLCSGGIFGLGESKEERTAFIQSVKALSPDTMPLNFYIQNPALPLKAAPLSEKEALEIITEVRAALPHTRLMVAGGRETTFKSKECDIFAAGADAIVIGDYLTTKGELPASDREMIERLGYEIATTCHA
ncbi:biotin synthase [Sulfurospirillum diekertiae]|uniref:Biotin synthase n=1 Tax=Sulfurospirillum diekertiae TaxID=1854492 RepID=A0A6G9VSM5_9BACT|nr:biotin synthase [Sulfurospirillum diekertiae]QIR75959.1 biotin synthase [Sulfurospirillum diekertiae]QIR78602.1 biotin synthase [Sulfurospirillum diekertiae]